jgi:hypothetical protein
MEGYTSFPSHSLAVPYLCCQETAWCEPTLSSDAPVTQDRESLSYIVPDAPRSRPVPLAFSLSFIQCIVEMVPHKGGHNDPLSNLWSMDSTAGSELDIRIEKQWMLDRTIPSSGRQMDEFQIWTVLA